MPAVTLPPSRNAGRSFASRSRLVSARGPSSASTTVVSPRPAGASTGTSSSANRPLGLGGDGPLVAAQREGVLVVARDPVALGDVLGRLAHRLCRVALGHPRVDQPPSERGVVHRPRPPRKPRLGLFDHPRGPAHRLRPAGEVEIALAEPDRAAGLVDRLQPGGAEPVDGYPRDLDRQAGEQRGHPGDVAVVLARPGWRRPSRRPRPPPGRCRRARPPPRSRARRGRPGARPRARPDSGPSGSGRRRRSKPHWPNQRRMVGAWISSSSRSG